MMWVNVNEIMVSLQFFKNAQINKSPRSTCFIVFSNVSGVGHFIIILFRLLLSQFVSYCLLEDQPVSQHYALITHVT